MDNLLCVFSDYIMLLLVESVIFIVFILAIYKDIVGKLRGGPIVTRGEKSLLFLLSFWGMSIIIVNIINSSEVISNHKIVVSLLNVSVITYLNFFNSYFRNKIIGWIGKVQRFEEEL